MRNTNANVKSTKSAKKKKGKGGFSNSRSPSQKKGFIAMVNDKSHQTLHPDMMGRSNAPTFYDVANEGSSREGSNSLDPLQRHGNHSGKLFNGEDDDEQQYILDP